jgi:uncharacterized protein YceK
MRLAGCKYDILAQPKQSCAQFAAPIGLAARMRRERLAHFVSALLSVCLALSTGCATVMVRGTGGKRYPSAYPATRTDLDCLHEILDKPDIPAIGPLKWLQQAAWAIPFMLDLPISAIIDTLLLPFDRSQPDAEKQDSQAETPDESIGAG